MNVEVPESSHRISSLQGIKVVPKEWGEERWIVNRDYCGKLLILKKGYRCSLHHHRIKDETFYVSKGRVLMECDGEAMIMKPGDALLIEPNTKHRFTGLEDSEIFEFSTHHEDSDSYRDELSGQVDLSKLMLPGVA
jgi:quercetin dioxygenase-like cupin family protein